MSITQSGFSRITGRESVDPKVTFDRPVARVRIIGLNSPVLEVRMRVGVLGSGDVAKTLASGFIKHGHEVKIGSRTPDKLADWAVQNS